MQRPSSKDYESMKNWLLDEEPFVQPEIAYNRRREDIVTLRKGREAAAFDCFVERVLSRLDTFLVASCQWHVVQLGTSEEPTKEIA